MWSGGTWLSPSRVSVPLRGIGSEKLGFWNKLPAANYPSVSVPLRGIGSEKLLHLNIQ